MIKFQAVCDDNGNVTEFTVKGHSAMAQCGSDSVCAAVSSAVWMAINGIERGKLAKLKYTQENGFVHCVISEKRSGADAVLNSLIYTVSELSLQYKKRIFMTRAKRG